MNTPIRRCTKCNQDILAISENFGADKRSPDGRKSICRNCVREQNAKYRADNRDLINDRSRTYYNAHKEEQQQRSRNYRAKNPDKIREIQRRYKQINPQKKKSANRRWQQNNLDKGRAKEHRRRARKRSLPHTFTERDWKFSLTYFNGACAYCENPPSLFDLNKVLHQEHHIPVSAGGGYTAGNILPACQSCNLSKKDTDPVKWAIKRFGKKHAKLIMDKIAIYFAQVTQSID